MALVRKPPKIKPTGSMVAGLPTYSPEQFQQVRPNGSYKGYLNFIKARRGVTKGPAYPGRGGPGLPTIMSMMQNMRFETPQQIEARAGRMTAANIAAQRGLAADAAKQSMLDAQRTSKALSSAGQVAAQMNKGLFGAVGGEYNAGARELANLGTGTVGAAAATTDRNVAATNEALARVGAPSVAATPAMAGPQQAGVQSYLGAGLPGQSMVRQGQAAEFGLAGLVNASQLRSTQEAGAALSQSTREIADKRQAAYQEIARGRPEVAAKILSDLQSAERQNMALGMSLLEARRGALQTGFEQSMTKKEYAASQAATKAAADQQRVENAQWNKTFAAAQEAAAKTGEQVDENRSIAFGYYVDQNGNPIMKNGKKIMVPKTAGDKDKKPSPLNARMGQSANYWVKDRLNRGKMTGTQTQLLAYLNAVYPGNPKLAARIAAATFPKGSGGKKFTAVK